MSHSRLAGGKLAIAALAALLLTTACGPTTRLVASRGAATVGSFDVTASTLAPTAGAVDGPTGVTTAAGAPQSAPTTTLRSAGASLGPVAQGVTATDLTIGIVTFNNTANATGAGLKGVPTQVGKSSYEAVIADFNRHGGIAGRKVHAVYYEIPIGSTRPSATLVAEGCAKLTQDNKVFAVLDDRSDYLGVWASCFAQHNTPFINDYEGYYDESIVANNPAGTYLPDVPIGQRIMRAWMTGLQRLGYFSPGAKIGLLRSDQISYDRVATAVRPALASYGLTLTSEAAINTSDQATLGSQVSAAVLKFKAAGVDHVILMDNAPILTVLFPAAAESQSYRPRYAINSYNTPNFSAANVPPLQLHGAIGIGWFPTFDVLSQPPPNSAARECNTIFRAAGVTDTDNQTVALNYQACSLLRFLKQAAERAPVLNPRGLRLGVASLGTSFIAAPALSTQFGPGRYDGSSSYRDIGFNDACTCFKYLTPDVHPMP